MPNVNASTSTRAPNPGQRTGTPVRGTLKGALATLVLLLLGLLFWLLIEQFQETLQQERLWSINYSADLADNISLNMALRAEIALNQLPQYEQPTTPRQQQALVNRLRQSLPSLHSLAWLTPGGEVLIDSTGISPDAAFLADWIKYRQPNHRTDGYYYASNRDASLAYLLLSQPSGPTKGYWLLRMTPDLLQNLTRQSAAANRPQWLIENMQTGRVLSHSGKSVRPGSAMTLADKEETVLLTPLSHSDWQLRGLFNEQKTLEALLPGLIGKCLLGLLFSLLPIVALMNMRRRQRQLHEGRRRYHDIFEGTGVALCVLDLASLPGFLEREKLNSTDALARWLIANPAHYPSLFEQLRITEVNQVAMHLLQVESEEGAWLKLINGCPKNTAAIGYRLIEAVITHQHQLELEIKLSDAKGEDQHLWLVVRVPETEQDYHAVILSITDITSRKLIELSLQERERFWSEVVRTVPDHLYVQDVNSQMMIFSNHHLGYSLGYNDVELHQMGAYFWEILLHPEDGERYEQRRILQRANAYSQLLQCQLRFRHRTGMWRRFDIREQALTRNARDQVTRIIGVAKDITDQVEASESLRMAATVFEHSTSAILITDPDGFIVQANAAFSRVSGYAVSQVLDQLPTMLTVDEEQQAHLRYIFKQLSQHRSWEGEVWLKRRNSEHYPAWVGITAVLDDEGDLASYVCFFSDISERKASEQRIHRLAYYDALTHLPNRTLFQDRLHTALQQAERHKSWVVLMFLDLDRFKPINDSLGHAAGDRMLKAMAIRLLACVGDDDTVARMGGDEFTLLLEPRDTRELALNRAVHVAEQILASLVKPFVLESREFFVTASIGIALSPQDGKELSQLMKNADTAMYHAKERGKNNFQFYQADMNASALERLELESDLRHALDLQEFILYYQPQFSGDGKRLTGVEALLRWNHPRRGLVPPGDFIPVLEELGLVVEVGDWVLTEACRQLKHWHQTKVRVPKVSVNISARQFSDGQLGTRIANILKLTGLPPACLELELTESILMREVSEALHILASLKNLGLSIAVDDFGTGYSSLNYLKQFPIDVLKIDRTFVDGLPLGEQDAQIARAIIAMAHSLNLSVIAEGVETHEQLNFLREHGCDEVQGYLFGRPVPAEQLALQLKAASCELTA